MTIEDEIYTRLTSHSGTSAIIGTRCYRVLMPQDGKLPAIVYQKVSTGPLYALDGDASLDRPRYQFSCLAKTHSDVLDLAAQVRSALSAYSDKTLDTPIHACFLDMEMDDFEYDVECYRIIIDFRIWHG